jgi:acetolactate decarboxylase
MRSIFFSLFFSLALPLFSQNSSVKREGKPGDGIHFVSLNHAIRSGQYDALTTVGRLKDYGDFGLGSTERVQDELVILDGIVYAIPKTGKARIAEDKAGVAFCAIKFFKADKNLKLTNVKSLKKLEDLLDSVLTNNSFAAIKVSGIFSSASYSSYHIQQKPYKPIEDVPITEFKKENIEGTLVGYFTPESAKVINSPVYHFHFIDKNRGTGGHLREIEMKSVIIEIDYASDLSIHLPDPQLMEHIDLNKPIK